MLVFLLMSWSNRKPDRVLVFSKNADNQPAAATAARALMTLAEKAGIDVDTTTSSAYITEDSLKNYQEVVFLNTSQDVLFVSQQIDIERFVQAGGGLALINPAGFTAYQWPWYRDMMGLNQPAQTTAPASMTRTYDGGSGVFDQYGCSKRRGL